MDASSSSQGNKRPLDNSRDSSNPNSKRPNIEQPQTTDTIRVEVSKVTQRFSALAYDVVASLTLKLVVTFIALV